MCSLHVQAFQDLLFSSQDPTFEEYWKVRQKKYNQLPWHDVDASDTVQGLLEGWTVEGWWKDGFVTCFCMDGAYVYKVVGP